MPRPRKSKEIQGTKTRDVNAGARATLALKLALEGHDWKTVAALSSYASAGAAWNAVQRELQRTIQPLADEVRQMELARLDALWQIQFKKAQDPNNKSADWNVDRCLAIMERRARYLGLDARPDTAQQQAQMIVIGVPTEVLEAV